MAKQKNNPKNVLQIYLRWSGAPCGWRLKHCWLPRLGKRRPVHGRQLLPLLRHHRGVPDVCFYDGGFLKTRAVPDVCLFAVFVWCHRRACCCSSVGRVRLRTFRWIVKYFWQTDENQGLPSLRMDSDPEERPIWKPKGFLLLKTVGWLCGRLWRARERWGLA